MIHHANQGNISQHATEVKKTQSTSMGQKDKP